MTKLETIIYAKNLILAAKSQNENAFDVIIESLDKQMPKKPIEKSPRVYHCPSCDGQDIEDVFIKKFNFCLDCGQALDWSEKI